MHTDEHEQGKRGGDRYSGRLGMHGTCMDFVVAYRIVSV